MSSTQTTEITRDLLFTDPPLDEINLFKCETGKLSDDDRKILLNYFERDQDLFAYLENPRRYFPDFPFKEGTFDGPELRLKRLKCPATVIDGKHLLMAIFSQSQQAAHYAMIPLGCKDIAWYSNK